MKKSVLFRHKAIAYQVRGSGRPVVFLHGFMEDSSMWYYHADALSQEFLCILIDLPGHGASDMVNEVHTMSLMAEVVQAVLQVEQINHAVAIVGHSMGGYVATAFARKYPQNVLGLVYFNSHAAADSDKNKAQRLRTIKLVEDDAMRFISAFIPNLFAPYNRKRLQSVIAKQQGVAKAMPSQAIVAALVGIMQRQDGLSLLKNLEIPVLFIRGAADERISQTKIEQQMATCKEASLLLLPYAGHMAWAEAPLATLESLKHFFGVAYEVSE